MLAYLRALLRKPPALQAPLRAADWDGQALTLACDDGAGEIALDVDGAYFASASAAAGRARFAFAFSPSGAATLQLLPRLGRDGPALAAGALRVRLGAAGLAAAGAHDPDALAPLVAPAELVPFGVDAARAEVAVVVPVYDAPEHVAACLDAVIAHTGGRVWLIVIDDASPDPAIAPLLARYADLDGVRVLRNPVNRGFTATANRGIAEAGTADVVLLNADTVVGPGWLGALRRAAHARADVATVTAVSDNAGAFSVPELEQANALPPGWSYEDAARALLQQAGLAYPTLPTGNGFCLYVRRAAFDAAGLLDEAAFPQGYGEENDFCQRAARHGLRHLIAGNVFVGHARSRSFGEERRLALGRAGMAVLRERWPDYEREVGERLFSFERRVLDWRVRRVFAAARSAERPRPRLLWVGAGAPAWHDAQVWNLRANGDRNELVADGRVVAANTWKADEPERSYRALWDWLQLYAIEALVVAERKASVAEILCEHLAIPIACVGAEPAASAREALQRAPGLRRFVRGAR